VSEIPIDPHSAIATLREMRDEHTIGFACAFFHQDFGFDIIEAYAALVERNDELTTIMEAAQRAAFELVEALKPK
jgi:hypothetical protein